MGQKDYKKYAVLLEAARNGDSEAFKELYLATSQPQLYYLRTILKEPEDAKDALQEVYLLLYQNMDKIHPPTVLVAYLNRLSYYVGKNMAKKLYRRNAHLADIKYLEEIEEPAAEEHLQRVENEEQSLIVLNTLNMLPEDERSVLFMRYFQQLKHQEVALSLGISPSKAKRLQSSAHAHMRELLIKQGLTGIDAAIPGLIAGSAAAKRFDKSSPNGGGLTGLSGGSGIGAGSSALASGSSAGVISAVAAVGLTALTLVGGSHFFRTPDIQSVKSTDVGHGVEARVEVAVDSPFPIHEVLLQKEDGTLVTGKRTGDGIYTATVKRNGRYFITVTANNGRADTSSVSIISIDETLPEADCHVKDGLLYITVSDLGSGIDYDNLYLTTASGDKIKPENSEPAAGTAVFLLPKEDAVLCVQDLAGNRAQAPISYRK